MVAKETDFPAMQHETQNNGAIMGKHISSMWYKRELPSKYKDSIIVRI